MMKVKDLIVAPAKSGSTSVMPVLFIGHGSPMNAIEENEFVNGWRETGKKLPRPRAILCISAHWETSSTFVTGMAYPPTIHDFAGFPRQLYDLQYPAPGSPGLALEAKDAVKSAIIGLDEKWGLDHGAWSVISRLFPEADIPVVQLSLNYRMTPEDHYNMAKELASLRGKGVLIIGSGNMVHNLGMIAWDKLDSPGYAFDWAIEAGEKMKENILNGDHRQLIGYRSLGRSVNMAVPTPEHFLPLLYVLALKGEKDQIEFFNDKAVAGSLTMTSVKIG